MTTQTPATAEIKNWLRPGFSQIFDSGSERKTQNPAGVDSGNPDPVPPLLPKCLLILKGPIWIFLGGTNSLSHGSGLAHI